MRQYREKILLLMDVFGLELESWSKTQLPSTTLQQHNFNPPMNLEQVKQNLK